MVNGSGANSFQFRPFEPTDTADLYTRTDAGLATNWTFSRAVTNEIVSGLTSAGSPALTKTTLVCASPTINFWKAQRISGGGNLFIAMMDCYDSTKKSVRVFNAGWSSSRCSDWKVTTSPWSPLNALIALNPDLVVIQPGINEYNNAGDQTGSPSSTVGGQFPATFQADLEIIVTALIAAGIDVILRTHYPSQNSSKTLVMQKAYRDVTIAVAANHSLIVDDVWGKLTTWEQANGKGWMADSLHPVGEGYRRSAESLAALVQGVMMA
jgi:lysophospholipase L1-like esterase